MTHNPSIKSVKVLLVSLNAADPIWLFPSRVLLRAHVGRVTFVEGADSRATPASVTWHNLGDFGETNDIQSTGQTLARWVGDAHATNQPLALIQMTGDPHPRITDSQERLAATTMAFQVILRQIHTSLHVVSSQATPALAAEMLKQGHEDVFKFMLPMVQRVEAANVSTDRGLDAREGPFASTASGDYVKFILASDLDRGIMRMNIEAVASAVVARLWCALPLNTADSPNFNGLGIRKLMEMAPNCFARPNFFMLHSLTGAAGVNITDAPLLASFLTSAAADWPHDSPNWALMRDALAQQWEYQAQSAREDNAERSLETATEITDLPPHLVHQEEFAPASRILLDSAQTRALLRDGPTQSVQPKADASYTARQGEPSRARL